MPERRTTSGTDGRQRSAGGIAVPDAAQAALHAVAELTGREPEGVTAVEPTEDGWLVSVEVVEDHRVPSSADILASYEAELDPYGELLSCRRSRRYPRGKGDNGGGR